MGCGININLNSGKKHGKLIVSGSNEGVAVSDEPIVFDASNGDIILEVSSSYETKQAVVIERVNKAGEVDANGKSLLAKFHLQKSLEGKPLRVEAYAAPQPEGSIEETDEYRLIRIGIPTGVAVEEETATFYGDGITNIFYLPCAFAPKSLKLWCNGVAQAPGLNYEIIGANSFMTNWMPTSEELLLIRFLPVQIAG